VKGTRLAGGSGPRRWKPALLGFLFALSVPPVVFSQAPESPGFCSVDTVSGVFTEGGFVEVIGVAVDLANGAPVEKVELILDGSPRGFVSLAGYRPDVLVHFGRADYLWSGWRGTAPLEQVWPGTHTISAIGYTRSGIQIPCGTREIEVQGPVTAPERPAWRIALGHL
jgi:hypothetical protein